jgi:hypothetical protein
MIRLINPLLFVLLLLASNSIYSDMPKGINPSQVYVGCDSNGDLSISYLTSPESGKVSLLPSHKTNFAKARERHPQLEPHRELCNVVLAELNRTLLECILEEKTNVNYYYGVERIMGIAVDNRFPSIQCEYSKYTAITNSDVEGLRNINPYSLFVDSNISSDDTKKYMLAPTASNVVIFAKAGKRTLVIGFEEHEPDDQKDRQKALETSINEAKKTNQLLQLLPTHASSEGSSLYDQRTRIKIMTEDEQI